MGQYIVREKYPRNPEKHSRVWRWEDLKKICAIPTEENHWIEAITSFSRDGLHNLPCAIANMKELRWLSYYKFPATSLSRNFQPTKLSYLGLKFCLLEQLWEGDKILPNLKVLDLSQSVNLHSTPDFQGLPCLERIRLNNCYKLTHIHPSISYHENLISVEMSKCISLETFPPISGMKKLETLILSKCFKLCKFPKIQMNMDNMVELSLRGTGIKVVPSSIGRYCTNLLSLDLRGCRSLESIEGNFHLLKHLKEFYLGGCKKHEILEQDLFDVNYSALDLCKASFKDLHPGMKFLGFSPSLTNGDISSVFCKLSNLQVLYRSVNDISRLHCSLLQLCSVNFPNLAWCYNVEGLSDLPECIAVLRALSCDKLKIVDLPTNLRWLGRISLPIRSISDDVRRKLRSMLQENPIKYYSIILLFYACGVGIRDITSTLTLELPRNWYNEFRDTLWWKSKHTAISFPIDDRNANLNVELVPRRSKGDSIERVKDTSNSTKFSDTKPIDIVHDSKSCIKILWRLDADDMQ